MNDLDKIVDEADEEVERSKPLGPASPEIYRLMRSLRRASIRRACERSRVPLIEALEFYADPETYHGCAFLFDPPTGGWDADFELEHGHPDYKRAMPGKLARAALTGTAEKEE